MKTFLKITLLALSISICAITNSYAQEIPYVYDVENTGADFPVPPLPSFDQLPIVKPLTDPFEWSDGSGRDTTFESWSRRRSEIKAEFEHYEIGVKPVRPDTITATYSAGLLTVNVTENGQTITLTSNITLPEGQGPFPAIIGMNSGSGSLPADIFTSRNVATVPFFHNQVVTYGGKSKSDPFYKLYPDLYYVGQYASWAWGISRLVDGLELVQDSLPIDLSHLAISGCSYAGKMALIGGALDERFALVIAQESGGGGAAAWRVSETLTGVESLGNTNFTWFMQSLSQFKGSAIERLPHDHHELMAMVAPRALLVLANPDMVWLADESGYVSTKAAQRVWKTFGVENRFGYVIEGGHSHCVVSNNQRQSVETFVERFLLGDTAVNTNIEIHTYPDVDYQRWTNWWGNGEPEFPSRDWLGTESIWLEAECGTVGSKWTPVKYPIGSNASVVEVVKDAEPVSSAPVNTESVLEFPFTTTRDTTYHFFMRLICAKAEAGEYWIKVDDGDYQKVTGLTTSGLQWKKLLQKELAAGDHLLKVAYSQRGAKIDKFCVSSLKSTPAADAGETAVNICEPQYVSSEIIRRNGFSLNQNFPNPYNGKTLISFEVPTESFVSLKVYDMQGVEIAELAGKQYATGKHVVEFNSGNLPKGMYFFTMNAGGISLSRKMIVSGK